MNQKNILKAIFTVSVILSVNSTSPLFKCETYGTTCVFSNVTLNSTHYEWVPDADDPSVIQKVTFTHSTIPIVTKAICETFPAVEALWMNNLGIEEIEEDAFHLCTELTKIDLGLNRIKKLHPATFIWTKKMNEIELYSNRIVKFDLDFFYHMTNLTFLHLGDNALIEFPPELVKNNKNLEYLLLPSNNLSDIEAEQVLESLPELKRFDLDDNEISCTRLFEITEIFTIKGIGFGNDWLKKKRNYEPEIIPRGLTCKPDSVWMVSNFRKQKGMLESVDRKNEQRFDEIQKRLDVMEEKIFEMKVKTIDIEAKIVKITNLIKKHVKIN